ncbi:MAG TPA: aminotransferase class I/II-fold pyridoxal phosphate-dependent enzyme [Actinomycetota bacterium]|nr:aminotransferase class I/II-fold pyridoxal phosphate-dependent enzyme [Actinomycetota bacterium]
MADPTEGFTTRALRTRVDLGDARPLSTPIYQTATYSFEDPEVLAELIRRGKDAGYVYTRWHNPTRAALEEVLAELEGGERAVSFSSGMAAISTSLLTMAKARDHVVASPYLYGGSFSLIAHLLPRWGIETTLAKSQAVEDLMAACRPETVLCYVETIGNPTLAVADLEAIGAACRERGVRLVVDNTFASPYLCNPIAFGADIVAHSTTKYIGGHSDLTGGIAVGDAETIKEIREVSVDLGGVASALEAWLVLRGLQTLALRMERHCRTALALARMLEEHDKVARVWYPGLESHPDHEVARRILRDASGMVAFELAGGLDAGRRFQEALELALVGPSLGGTRTLVVHAASVTHTQLTPEDRKAAGIAEGLVRVSVGIEDQEDLLDDFSRALDKA